MIICWYCGKNHLKSECDLFKQDKANGCIGKNKVKLDKKGNVITALEYDDDQEGEWIWMILDEEEVKDAEILNMYMNAAECELEVEQNLGKEHQHKFFGKGRGEDLGLQ